MTSLDVIALKERIAELEAENAWLRSLFEEGGVVFPPAWDLSPAEGRLLIAVLRRPIAEWPYIIDVMYGHDPDGGPNDPVRTLRVIVSHLRPKLISAGIVLRTVWGRGFVIDEPTRGEWLRRLTAIRRELPLRPTGLAA